MDFIELLRQSGIELYAAVPLARCAIKLPRMLDRAGFVDGSALMLAVPYYTCDAPDGASLHDLSCKDLSLYARPLDYHGFFDAFFTKAVNILKQQRPDAKFAGFADSSPLYEVPSAARAGLGVIGAHGLLITKKYSSFVFLGEIISDMPARDWDALTPPLVIDLPRCPGAVACGACARACPASCISTTAAAACDNPSPCDNPHAFDKTRCISALTQKKGDLTPGEAELVRRAGSAWGCDACQLACPHTKAALAAGTLTTPIPYFREAIVSSAVDALALDDSAYARRAYSWRPRAVLARNAELLK